MRAGDRILLRVGSLAFGGDGVGRTAEGQVVFVAGVVPGDRVELRILEVRKGWARGELERVIEAGASRVAAPCPLVASCGGCQWQEVSGETQRAAKQAIVERALGRLGARVMPLDTPTGEFGYRTRARLSVSSGERGGLVIGFNARRSHRVVDVASCPLLHPALDHAFAAAREALRPSLRPGASLSGLVGKEGVQLAVEGALPDAASRAEKLLGRARILGILLDGAAVGAPEIDTSCDGEPPFFATADGFAQASHDGNRALRRRVGEAASASGARVLELHAGDGNFTRDLVRGAASVVAVEGAPRAASRLARNAPAATAIRAPVEEDATRRAAAGERYDLVLLDPPRAGARPILAALARLTDRIVYVSCDPMTLARDAAELAALGLRPRHATPIDLMPQTFHVETVLLLER